MNRPFLSIVTVCKDHRKGLRRTLQSIAVQRGVDLSHFESVVIDGCSRDGSVPEALQFSSTLPLRLTSEPDNGIYDAMNKGWRSSAGDWVQFLNAGDALADDLCLRDVLAKLQAISSDWLVAKTGFLDYEGEVAQVSRNVPHRFWLHALGFRMHAHPSTLMRASLLARLQGFDERFGFAADFDLVFRAGRASRPSGWDRLLVHFEPAGVSQRHLLDVPDSLHAIRAARLRLRGPLLLADRAFTRCLRVRWYRSVAVSSQDRTVTKFTDP
jgi:glycosyltransferase involved in cell wall biosynthesis